MLCDFVSFFIFYLTCVVSVRGSCVECVVMVVVSGVSCVGRKDANMKHL